MKSPTIKTVILALTLVSSGSLNTLAQSELEELKAKMKAMEQTMEQMKQKISEMEQQKGAPVSPVPTAPGTGGVNVVTFQPTTKGIVGHASPIEPRNALNDQQEAAPRPNDLTLDPKYRGFVPIPNTDVLIKFNAKPRVDITDDPQN